MKGVRAAAAAAAALALAAAAAAGLLVSVPGLAVRDTEQKKVAFLPLGRDATFDISYRHSVALCPVLESFRAGRGGEMLLVRTVSAGLGAGLPFGDEGGTVRIEDGRIVLEGLRRSYSRIPLLPLPLTAHRLRAGGRTVDLAALAAGRGVVVLTIERRPAALATAEAAIFDIGRWIRGNR